MTKEMSGCKGAAGHWSTSAKGPQGRSRRRRTNRGAWEGALLPREGAHGNLPGASGGLCRIQRNPETSSAQEDFEDLGGGHPVGEQPSTEPRSPGSCRPHFQPWGHSREARKWTLCPRARAGTVINMGT